MSNDNTSIKDHNLMQRLKTYVLPMIPTKDHCKWTDGISFRILSSIKPIPLYTFPEIPEPIYPCLTYDLSTLLASPPICDLILTTRSTYGSPNPTIKDGPQWVTSNEAMEWLKQGLQAIKSSRIDGEGLGWQGRGMILGGTRWEDVGVDDPYPLYRRPMEPLLTRSAIRETPCSTRQGHFGDLGVQLKRQGVPEDVKSVVRLFEMEEGDDVLGGWEYKEGCPKRTESEILNLTITLSLEQVSSIRECLGVIARTMPGKSRVCENENAIMLKKRVTEEREWVEMIERTNAELESKPRQMSPPLFNVRSELQSEVNSTDKNVNPLDLLDVFKEIRAAVHIPTKPALVRVPKIADESSSDSGHFKRQKIEVIGMMEPLSRETSDEDDPMSMHLINDMGTPFSPPPTSIRVDSPFIDKMRHPKYQHGFLGVDAEWKNGGEDLEGVRKWENLQMELPIFKAIHSSAHPMETDRKVLLQPVLESCFDLSEEHPADLKDETTNLASMVTSNTRSSPLPDAMQEFGCAVKAANAKSGYDIYDVVMKEQLNQQEGGAMSQFIVPYMASNDRARSAQITLSVPTAFHQIFRSNQQGVANPDQPDLGVIRVLPMTSATAELNWVPFSYTSKTPLIGEVLGSTSEDNEQAQALLCYLQVPRSAVGTLDCWISPALDPEPDEEPLVEKTSLTTSPSTPLPDFLREEIMLRGSWVESSKSTSQQLDSTELGVTDTVAIQPAFWTQHTQRYCLDALVDWQPDVVQTNVPLDQAQGQRGLSRYLALRGKAVVVEEDPENQDKLPEMVATSSSQRSSNQEVKPHPAATNSSALQVALANPSHQDTVLHCLVRADLLKHRQLVTNLETSKCILNPLDVLEADILISTRTAVLVRNLAALPAEREELSIKLQRLALQFEQVVCVFEMIPYIQLRGNKRMRINPCTPPVISALDKLRGMLERRRAIDIDTEHLRKIDLAFVTTGTAELGSILQVYSSWDRHAYEAQGLSADEAKDWMTDRDFLGNEINQFEQGLIANYGLNTFAALYVASLGSVDQLFNVGEDARLDWFGSRLGVEVTNRMNVIIAGKQQSLDGETENSMEPQLYSEGDSFDTI